MGFAAQGRKEIDQWGERVLVRHEYACQGKVAKGLLRRYVEKEDDGLEPGAGDAADQELSADGADEGGRVYKRHQCAARDTKDDVALLADVGRAHGKLRGPATRRILERESEGPGSAAYARLARIRWAQIYRLRATAACRKRNVPYAPARPPVVAIGPAAPA